MPQIVLRINLIFIIENLLLVLKLFYQMQSISFCFIDFENVHLKRYTVYSLKFNTSTATVGRINRNGIVTFGKTCHLPSAGTALICCTGRKVLISVFRNPASGETRTVGSHRKKLQAILICSPT